MSLSVLSFLFKCFLCKQGNSLNNLMCSPCLYTTASFSDEDNTQTAVSCVEDCQLELDQMSQMANEEILKVEQKYNTARKPAYEQRNKYIKKISGFWAKVVRFSFKYLGNTAV